MPTAGLPFPTDRSRVEGESRRKLASRPLQVTNAFVHGDSTAHIMLTPGLLSATADLTCEVILRLVNVHAYKHGSRTGRQDKASKERSPWVFGNNQTCGGDRPRCFPISPLAASVAV